MGLFSLIYVSSAVEEMSNDELSALLAKSRENNARLGVTGLLLYRQGNFMQLLEGEREAVEALHARIARDPRHRGLITLLQTPIDGREFADWSMGFRNLDLSGEAVPEGFSDFLNHPFTGTEFTGNPTRAQTLLLTFKKHM